jgi:hypothetical protein
MWSRLIYRAALYTEPPYIQSRLMLGAVLYPEPPDIPPYMLFQFSPSPSIFS